MILVRIGWAAARRRVALAVALGLAACAPAPPPVAPSPLEAMIAAAPLPEGYFWQPLAETGGQVPLPLGWFFTTGIVPDGWTWMLTKEDPRTGSYRTGMRLRVYLLSRMRLAESDGPAVADKVAQLIRARAKEVLGGCQITQIGRFKRYCLETLEVDPSLGEGTFRVLYTVHWGAMGMVYTTMFGAPAQEWAATADIRNIMLNGTLVGPNPGRPAP